ncbi:MAG: SDR family oxidoreductase [Candidatus Omnitrophota bacterium]|nr:SDR family oxidoreductase [Candidatus Omnitrophota bacterium]
MDKFLVTGGAGFIGSHIVERLLKDGHFVRVLDNLSSGKKENLDLTNPNLELFVGDIVNYEDCRNALRGIEFCLHQAALRSVPKSMLNPYDYNKVNIDGILNMLRAAREAGIKRFVFASSSSVYGDTNIFPQKEEHLPRLISPYALSKLAGEYYCRIFSKNYGLETVSLRYFNVFGPRQALDDEYSVVIPKFIANMLKDLPPPVHGDGRQSRDFTYVESIVEANVLSALTANVKCEVFNAACGKDYSILEIVGALNKIMHKKIRPVFEPSRMGDVKRTLADISRIKKSLKYRPQVSFEDGLATTVNWVSSRL